MRVAFFNAKPYDRRFFEAVNTDHGHRITFLEPRLSRETAPLAEGVEAVCAFVNDSLDRAVLATLAAGGTRLIALRSAGFNHVDLAAAAEFELTVVRVPAYSPDSVAEHTVGLMLALDRRIHRAHARVREGNFALDGLLGRELRTRTVGIVGTGKIGAAVARIMHGFGCRILASDVFENPDLDALGVEYVPRDVLFAGSDIITLHCPLTPETVHMIGERSIGLMRPGVMLINTSRGALVDTPAAIEALKEGRIGSMGLDVYEEEADLFFEDLSDRVIQDDVFSRLLTFPNVIVTGHQAFFTEEALRAIAETTLESISAFAAGTIPDTVVSVGD
jgi:D-lactate dehydrogenase